jgi:predicted RNA-binding protein with RPS1 domain
MTTVTTKAPKQVAINDIGSADDFLAAVEKTLKFFNDGDLIEGTVVKIDRDEVLLDVGYKTEGVIPSRELSIKHDVDPTEVVEVGDTVEALVLQKEDKEGRLILSKKRAQYERAWGDVEKIKDADGVVTGTVIEVVKGGLIVDIGLRGFLPASLIELRRVRDLTPYSARRSRPRSSSSTRTATTWSCRAARSSSRRSPRAAPRSSTTSTRARSARASCRRSSTSVRSSTWAASTVWFTSPN